MLFESMSKVAPQCAKIDKDLLPIPSPDPCLETPRQHTGLMGARLPVTWEEDEEDISSLVRSFDAIASPTKSPKRRQTLDASSLQRFIMHGTSVQTNPKDPSTWPVHGGMRDLISKAIAERKTVESQQRFGVILPDGKLRMVWDILMLHSLMFVAIFTPFQMSFLQRDHDLTKPEKWIFFFTLDRLVDLFFLVDIAFNFRSGWYEDDGSIISFDQAVAAQAYLRGWFCLDFLSLVPWEILALVVVGDSSSAFRLPKLLKLLRLIKILKLVRTSRVVSRLEQNIGMKNGVVRLLKFAISTIIIAHWLGCSLMFVSTMDSTSSEDDGYECMALVLDGDVDTPNRWYYNLYCNCDCTAEQLYVAALYWSVMTITTIGYGDITPVNTGEMTFMLVGMVLGAALFSFVVGTCVSLIEGLDKVGLEFQAECDAVNDYMAICKTPVEMRRRARAFMQTRRNTSSKRNEADILELMSPSLRQEFIIMNYSKVVRSVPPLAGASDKFIVEMAGLAVVKLYGPGEGITFQGEKNDPFYTLRKGEVIVCRSHCPGLPFEFVKRFRNAGFWNERLLIFDSFTDCAVKAIVFVELLAFDSTAVRILLTRYPQGKIRVKQIVLRRLWKHSISKASLQHAIEALNDEPSDVVLPSSGHRYPDRLPRLVDWKLTAVS